MKETFTVKSVRTGLGWGSDPDFPVADWQYEVSNDDTRQGYWEWVEQNREEARQDEGSHQSRCSHGYCADCCECS